MRAKSAGAAIGAIAAILTLAIASDHLWNAIGAAEISPAGWLAMGFGVIAALALGSGLMALMFFSSRRGYDDDAADEREIAERRSEGGGGSPPARSPSPKHGETKRRRATKA
jgi:hypothetical protein